ncbi:hypothetical protein HanPI659440_Chr02g0083861 [Helianthus annuus]|uniref:Uncharacterized protein n=1 Tax=Helianthus annuus TaxID=4232 RepID=A0A251SZQ6_HELAN|nr:hypothetical protein HanXRQr2_Chr02g0074111 [Helianthus annuus]KAJ0605334.1 hypothetical protein HanHA300_Chr02g0061861 [Helianthus annuus]KAJ0619349.1 hypothetical protein HanHA89_Chr02g0070361 [Helianthus annuus]KAJ0805928.1 hypothetical protein HanPI659440_Chr02g0083861 [Helianthus annuus]
MFPFFSFTWHTHIPFKISRARKFSGERERKRHLIERETRESERRKRIERETGRSLLTTKTNNKDDQHRWCDDEIVVFHGRDRRSYGGDGWFTAKVHGGG